MTATTIEDATEAVLPLIAPRHSTRADVSKSGAILRAGALQSAIFNGANFSSIATDANGVIQIFDVGAERLLGYAARRIDRSIIQLEKARVEWH